MLPISTGARIDRWDNGRPAHREQARLIEVKLERSSRYLCSEAFITFISERHDEDAPLANCCALQPMWLAHSSRKNGPAKDRQKPIDPAELF